MHKKIHDSSQPTKWILESDTIWELGLKTMHPFPTRWGRHQWSINAMKSCYVLNLKTTFTSNTKSLLMVWPMVFVGLPLPLSIWDHICLGLLSLTNFLRLLHEYANINHLRLRWFYNFPYHWGHSNFLFNKCIISPILFVVIPLPS